MPLPDPRLRIPPTKTSGVIGQPQQQQQNVNTPKNPNVSPLAPTQQAPQMKKGGSVKCMKEGGVVSSDMKKIGRKSVKVSGAPIQKATPVIGKTKRGYGAAKRG